MMLDKFIPQQLILSNCKKNIIYGKFLSVITGISIFKSKRAVVFWPRL